jgi:CARDB
MLAVPLMLVAAALSPASVKLADCSVEERSAVFYGRMKAVEGTERMSMRFTLLDGDEALRVPALARWHRSKPGVGTFGYRQVVRGLRHGRVYRARVTFRWHSATGEIIARTRRTSRACRQFEELPNLTSAVTGIEPTKVPGVFRYMMRVSNTGAALAEDLEAQLSVDGGVVDTVTVASLEPGQGRDLTIMGPACTTSVSSMVDPDDAIVESSEDDNAHTLGCQA